jgi:hypothetical protein
LNINIYRAIVNRRTHGQGHRHGQGQGHGHRRGHGTGILLLHAGYPYAVWTKNIRQPRESQYKSV